jgi:hypothetical protein
MEQDLLVLLEDTLDNLSLNEQLFHQFITTLNLSINSVAATELHSLLTSPPVPTPELIHSVYDIYRVLIARYRHVFPSQKRRNQLSVPMLRDLHAWERHEEVAELDPGGEGLVHPDWARNLRNLARQMKHLRGGMLNFSAHSSVEGGEPKLFEWTYQRDTYKLNNYAYRRMQGSSLFTSHLHPSLLLGMRFMHFHNSQEQTYAFSADNEAPPYRNERVCHVFHWFLVHDLLGLAASDFALVIEYGGGTGDNAPVMTELGFRGAHVVLDLLPMLLAQRFFLRASGHAAVLLTPLTAQAMHQSFLQQPAPATPAPTPAAPVTLLVPPDVLAAGAGLLTSLLDSTSLPSSEALRQPQPHHQQLLSLLLGTWSLTESTLRARALFLQRVRGVAVVYVACNIANYDVNNVQYLAGLMTSALRGYGE